MLAKTTPEIVIVGAGPIGIAYAWGIKQINPKIEITILEKY
jgi:protoporphyrinogen oxidase